MTSRPPGLTVGEDLQSKAWFARILGTPFTSTVCVDGNGTVIEGQQSLGVALVVEGEDLVALGRVVEGVAVGARSIQSSP